MNGRIRAFLFLAISIAPGIVMSIDNVLNQQMAEVSDFFTGKIKGDIEVLYAGQLDRAKLDYSLKSLATVDKWLDVLRSHHVDPQTSGAADSIVWTGAYTGEVIRRCATKHYNWVRYDDYMATQKPELRKVFPYTFGTQILLTTDRGAMTLPINKVVRYLEEGPENSLEYYASVECRPAEK